MVCNHCHENKERGFTFCDQCGQYLVNLEFGKKKPSFVWNAFSIGAIFCAVVTGLVVLLEMIGLLAASPTIISDLAHEGLSLFYITPEVRQLIYIEGTGLQLFFVFEMVIAIILIGILAYETYNTYKKSNNNPTSLLRTPLVEASTLNALVLVVHYITILIVIALGMDIGDIDIEVNSISIASLLNASIYEEFLCRVLMLGLPIAIVQYVKDKKKDSYKSLIGRVEYEHWMILFVIFSSFMFGAAHLSGWNAWKFFPTFAFGIVAGYLFLKHGIWASVFIHFFTDLTLIEMWWTGMSITSLGIVAMCFFSLLTIPTFAKRAKKYFQDFKKYLNPEDLEEETV